MVSPLKGLALPDLVPGRLRGEEQIESNGSISREIKRTSISDGLGFLAARDEAETDKVLTNVG
jgi:hypothetical protein